MTVLCSCGMPILASLVEVSPLSSTGKKHTQKHGTTNVSPPPKAQIFLNSKESNSRLDTSVGTVVDWKWKNRPKRWTRWWQLTYLLFSPQILGEMIQLGEHIFQMGWNYQLVKFWRCIWWWWEHVRTHFWLWNATKLSWGSPVDRRWMKPDIVATVRIFEVGFLSTWTS